MPDLTNLDVEWVSLVDRAAVRDPENQAEPMRFLVWKREHGNQPTNKGGRMTPEEMKAALAKAEQERDQLKADLEKSTTDQAAQKTELEKAQADRDALKAKVDKTEEPEEVIKKDDLPEPVRKALEKSEAEATANRERAEKAEKAATEASDLAKSERDERLNKEFIAKAEAFKALPVKKDEFGPVLKAAHEKLSKEEFEAIETLLKAADEQIAASDLFKEQGRTHGAADTGALAEAKQKAEELRKSDSTLTQAQALDKAFKENPELEQRYLAEIR
jgi:hypothetical protein